jgi:hypothetical protein
VITQYNVYYGYRANSNEFSRMMGLSGSFLCQVMGTHGINIDASNGLEWRLTMDGTAYDGVGGETVNNSMTAGSR